MKTKIFELAAVDLTLYKFILPLMQELQKNGFEVLCGAKDHGHLEKINREGFKTYDIPFIRSLNPLALIKSFHCLVKILKTENIHILHTHTPIASMVGRAAACFSGVKVKIYTVHGFILKPKIYYFLEKFMARRLTDYIFTVNQEDCDIAGKHQFIAPDKIMNIHGVGINTAVFNPSRFQPTQKEQLRKELNMDSRAKVIGYVGRIVKSKGVLDLVQAFIKVQKLVPCKLLLAGPWDFDERADEAVIEDIQKIITEKHLEKEIILTGYREEIASILSVMDIFVLPSYREGMPVSLLEAMAMEKAVIGTNIRGTREEITPQCGLLYEPKEVEGLKKHLLFYLDNPDKAKEMGKQARQRVIDHFSLEQVLQKQIQVLSRYRIK